MGMRHRARAVPRARRPGPRRGPYNGGTAVAQARTPAAAIPVREKESRSVGPFLYRLGRLLQLVGMLMLPLAIAGELLPKEQNPLSLKTSLLLSGVGVCVFVVG